MKILAIYPLTRGLQPIQKRIYTDFFHFSKNPKKIQNAKNHQKSKSPKTPRDMRILAIISPIYPSTRGLQPTRKRSYTDFSHFSKNPKKNLKLKNRQKNKSPKTPRDMRILAIYPSTRGLQLTRKHSYTDFSRFSKNPKKFEHGKNHQKSKSPKTPRDMKILAIRSSTRGL